MASIAAVDELHCVLCCEDIVFSAGGRCDHSICLKCCVKLRILRKEKDCPVCRTPLKEVIVSRGFKKWSEKSLAKKSHYGRKDFGIQHEEAESYDKVDEILQHRCPECAEVFKTFPLVKDHVRKTHVRFYCEICLRNLKLFTHERKCYTREELIRHRKVGDEDDRSYRGHPLCQFCEERFLDNDELLVHLRKTHFWCHLCEKDGSQEYYPEYDVLRGHFSEQHYLCEEGDCIHDKFTSVFRSKIDYQAHRSQKHADQLSKAEARQVRQLDVDIRYAPRQSDSNGVISNRDYSFPESSIDISGRDMRVNPSMNDRSSGQARNFGKKKDYDQHNSRENQRRKDTKAPNDGIAIDRYSSGPRKNYGGDNAYNEKDSRCRGDRGRNSGRESPRNIPQKHNNEKQRPQVNKRRADGVDTDNASKTPQSNTAEVDKTMKNDQHASNSGQKIKSNTTPPKETSIQTEFAHKESKEVERSTKVEYVHRTEQFPTLSGEDLANQESEANEYSSVYKNRAPGKFQEDDFPTLGGSKPQNMLHQKPKKQLANKKQNSGKKMQDADKFVEDFPALGGHVPETTSNVKKSRAKNGWNTSKEPTKSGADLLSQRQNSTQNPTGDTQRPEYSKQGHSNKAEDFPELPSQSGGNQRGQIGKQQPMLSKKAKNKQSDRNKPVLQIDDFPTLTSSDSNSDEVGKNRVPGGISNTSTATPGANLANSQSKKKNPTVKPPPMSYQEDFPKLPNAPPGLSRPPPGLTWSAPPSMNGLLQPTGEDTVKQRNQLLIEEVSRILYQRGQHFDDFKSLSGKYRTGSITAQTYYSECCRLLGDRHVHKVFRKLIDLLPDEEKQKELLAVYNDAKVVSKQQEPIDKTIVSQQTVPILDDFPTLSGKKGKHLQTNVSKAWTRGK